MVTRWPQNGECFKRELYEHEICVRLRLEWSFSVLEIPCVMRGGTSRGTDNEFVISVVSFR